MSHKTLKLGFYLQIFILAACSTQSAKNTEDGKSVFYDSAFNDRNRAPASFSPPEKMLGGSPQDPFYLRTQADYYFSMAEAYSLEGNHPKAIEAFKMTMNYDSSSVTVQLRLANEYLRSGLMTEALDVANGVAEKDPENIEAKMILGGIYSNMRMFGKAIENYEYVYKKKPDNLEVPLYLGAIYSETKQFDKAVKFFEAMSKNPDYPAPHLAYYYIGRVRGEQKDEKNQKLAEQAFKKCLEIKPDFSEGILALGSYYLRKNEDQKALQIYAQFQKKFGPNTRIADILSQMYVEKEMYDEAYEQYEILEAQSEASLNIKLKMSLILIEKKIYDKAIAKLEEVLKEAPESDKVRFYLGAVFEETKQDDKAIAHFKKIPPSSQYYAEAVIHTAYLLKGMGKITEGIQFMETALANKKDYAQMVAMYASLLDEKGDIQKASVVLEKGTIDFPDNAQIRFYYGTLQDRMGKKEQVIDSMKKVIELDPNHVQGLNYLAFTWAETGAHLEEAEKLARRALDIEPRDGYILDTLGWILYKRGQFTQSVQYLESAHKFQPNVSVIAEHLGDAYHRQAMNDKALRMYEKALEFETDIKKIDEIRSKLTALQDQKVIENRTPASLYKEK